MKEVEQLLEDAALVESVYDAQEKRHRHNSSMARTQRLIANARYLGVTDFSRLRGKIDAPAND
jgi:hypothetical protein